MLQVLVQVLRIQHLFRWIVGGGAENRTPLRTLSELNEARFVEVRSDEAGLSARIDTNRHESNPPLDDSRLDLRAVVETALARALILAAEAGRWVLVSHLAGELEARRVGRQRSGDGGVVGSDHVHAGQGAGLPRGNLDDSQGSRGCDRRRGRI